MKSLDRIEVLSTEKCVSFCNRSRTCLWQLSLKGPGVNQYLYTNLITILYPCEPQPEAVMDVKNCFGHDGRIPSSGGSDLQKIGEHRSTDHKVKNEEMQQRWCHYVLCVASFMKAFTYSYWK
jgi:hypothetical protein